MDEIEYKLESKNPVLISHAISRLLESIRKKCHDPGENHATNVSEFKLLLSKRDSADPNLSLSVYQALIALVENGSWDVGSALSTFTSSIPSAKNYVGIATALSRALAFDSKLNNEKQSVRRFTLHVPPHPFVMILTRDSHSWRAVLNQMNLIMTHRDRQVRENSIETLRPVFLYVLCNPSFDLSEDCKQRVWQSLISSKRASKLETEVLLWMRLNGRSACADTNGRILKLAEIALLEGDENRCSALLPMIASLTIRLLEHGFDPGPNLEAISIIVDRWCDNRAGNVTLALMAEIITLCPAIYLYDVLAICAAMVNKMVLLDDVFLNVLAASLLKWMAYPSVLCSDALDVARDLTNKVLIERKFSKKNEKACAETPKDPLFAAFCRSDSYVRFYAQVVRQSDTWAKDDTTLLWSKNLSLVPIDGRSKYKLLLSGLLLRSNDPAVTASTCTNLVEIARERKAFGSHVLSLLLHKLSRSRSSVESKCLLLAIPQLVTTKENVPIIAHTLNTFLNGDKQLKYFAVELYLKALKGEPRCYRFVSAAIIRIAKSDDRSWYSNATCARAINYICENHSEHGEKLVPLLSQILNRSADVNDGTASALALKSIAALCKFAVIEVCSTWRVLAPKMEKEKRSVVLESLCDFFAGVPSYPFVRDEEYDQLVTEVVSTLWRYAIGQDAMVAKSALRALSYYALEQIPLSTLPSEYRQDLTLPAAYARNPIDAARKPEDVLPYVPGTCWIQMLRKISKTILSAAGDLLISFITKEVTGFRSGIYVWPQGEPRDFKYLPEKSVIRAVGEYLRRSGKFHSWDQRIVTECLRIFAHRYPKPLPNVIWSFLEEALKAPGEIKSYALTIACRHTSVSLSARSLAESYLSTYKGTQALESIPWNEYLIPYSCLEDLCQALQSSYLQSFLEATQDRLIARIDLNDEAAIDLFDRTMSAYGRALKNPEIHDGNYTLLSTMLEKLFDRLDLTRDCFRSYHVAALELSTKQLERLASPRLWWEITPEKLKNAIYIVVESTLKRKSTEKPMTWMSEIVDVTASVPSAQVYLLENVQRIQSEMRFEKSSIDWILDLMARMQGLMVEPSVEDNDKIHFYCNVLFVSVVCLAGIDCTLTRRDSLIVSQDVRARLFPEALAVLSDRSEWKYAIPQIMEWLHYVRTSSLPRTFKSAFHESLINLRHDPFYERVWTKYLSVETVVDI